jgi:4-azaleucine resistance transporter AzlC
MRLSRRSEFLAGARAQLPLLAGVAPFGMAYGAYAVESGLSSTLAQAMSVIVFGGASQFVGVQQMSAGVPGAIIVLTAFLVNLRHMLYGASLAPHLEHLNARWRWLLAYLLTDEAYAMAIVRYREPDAAPHRHWFVLGTGVALWVCWQVTTALGVVAGAAVPESWALDFALPLTFLAIVVPAMQDRRVVAAALVAAIVAVAAYRWPYGTGLITAALCGIAAGLFAERVLRATDGTLVVEAEVR